MTHTFRYEYTNVPDFNNESFERLMKVYETSNEGLPLKIDLENRFTMVNRNFEKFANRIRNFKVRKDDFWVVTMPKCGTTWMLELVWLLQNDLDYKTALKVEQEVRCPYLEYSIGFPFVKPLSIDTVEKLKSPRVIKSHLPVHLLPRELWTVKPKIVYVTRDPKDAALSGHHFYNSFNAYPTTLDQTLNAFLEYRTPFSPFWPHVAEFWMLRNEPYVYFTSFERMKKHLQTVVQELAEFLNKPINSRQTSELLDHLSFDKMKKNPTCNHMTESRVSRDFCGVEDESFRFVRNGKNDSHKENFTDDMVKKFDDWTEKNLGPYNVNSNEILLS